MRDDERGAGEFRFRKAERIRTRREISKVFDEGARWSAKGMRFNVCPNSGADTRAVFVTVRKYGNAVERNRARRVVSECWRLAKSRLVQGVDVVVVIYPDEDRFDKRQAQLESLIRRASLAV
ncbi:MAG: ribonuclease P protein component [Spirochaetae bacterium HGW-Spirochaetae-7]|nr:MAG: ribonuclease P protein component [Spirochaetae bacterium HGW-Spirochaetae-7]